MLEGRGLVQTYGTVNALQGADFVVEAGTVTALIGDNGAGKSTLVKVLSGVEQPDDGTILLDGEPVVFRSPMDAHRLGIETVFQDLALAPHLDAAANVFLGREIRRGSGVHRQAGDAPVDDDGVRRPRRHHRAGRVGAGDVAVGRPASGRRDRPLGDVGEAGDLPRRADRRTRSRPDPPGARPDPPDPRPGTRRRADHAHAARRDRRRRPRRGVALRPPHGARSTAPTRPSSCSCRRSPACTPTSRAEAPIDDRARCRRQRDRSPAVADDVVDGAVDADPDDDGSPAARAGAGGSGRSPALHGRRVRRRGAFFSIRPPTASSPPTT